MDDHLAPRPPKGRYSEEEIERGLLTIALVAGNTRRAARELKAQGHPVPRTTLSSWQDIHADRLAELRRDVVPQIQARMAQQSEDLAERQVEAQHKAIDRFLIKVAELGPRDAASAVRDMAVSRAVNIDKAQLLRGQPTEIVQHDVQADIRALVAGGVAEIVGNESPRAP